MTSPLPIRRFRLWGCESKAHDMCPGFEVRPSIGRFDGDLVVCTCVCGHLIAQGALARGELAPPAGVSAGEMALLVGAEGRIEAGLDEIAQVLVKPLSSIADAHYLQAESSGHPKRKPARPHPYARCSGCGAEIIWGKSETGGSLRLDALKDHRAVVASYEPNGTPSVRIEATYSLHVCPNAEQFRRKASA